MILNTCKWLERNGTRVSYVNPDPSGYISVKEIEKEVYVFEHLVDGFDKAVEIAKDGDVVLLSPASASWDQYKECEVRGAEFKDKVKALK